ncbi:hypothetical protein LINGRAHAP2_LOCUS31942 [Linum grandiflorum]
MKRYFSSIVKTTSPVEKETESIGNKQPTTSSVNQSRQEPQSAGEHQNSGATKEVKFPMERRSDQGQRRTTSRRITAILGCVRFYLTNLNSMFSSMNNLMLIATMSG